MQLKMQNISDVVTEKQKQIDNRQSTKQVATNRQSIIDNRYNYLREKLRDENLGKAFVAHISKHLTEAQISSIADYASRKANHPGKAFVAICCKEVQKKC